MRILAISDVHVGDDVNLAALQTLRPCPDDWLILGGDIGETRAQLEGVLESLQPRFRQLVWVPGNHDLWSLPSDNPQLNGPQKYAELVAMCRSRGVLTPEDPYPLVNVGSRRILVAPLFLLYDYSFRPDEVPAEAALEWAAQSGVVCADEYLLRPHPYQSVADWCHARCASTEARLRESATGVRTLLINHWPLHPELAVLPRIPRFSLWCGTRRTSDWHLRYNAEVVVSGHLHLRSTRFRDGTRFEEVSLGYSRQWSPYTTVHQAVRCVFP